MASLPVETLLGIYLGLLVGVIPALAAWGLGFAFRRITGLTVPTPGVTVLAVALAGINGGLLALADRPVIRDPNAPRILTAALVVALLSVYAHSRGDAVGATIPERLSPSGLRSRTLSTDLAETVGDDEVRVRVVGEVTDMEGYPPLPEALRAEIRTAELRLPADLRLEDLERRVAERLRTEFDLGDVSVSVDERGRATVVAAPPFSGLSKRVADGRHAVSVEGLVPTGLARGDEVTVITPDAQVRGTVVSARTGDGRTGAGTTDDRVPETEPRGDDEPADARPTRAPTTDGGEGRVTVAVTRTDVQPLLRAGEAKIVVESRGTQREYEAVSMLRRAERVFRRLTVRAGSALAGRTVGAARIRDRYDTAVVAVRKKGGWQLAPRGTTTLAPGDELFAVGTRESLAEFAAVLDGDGDGGSTTEQRTRSDAGPEPEPEPESGPGPTGRGAD